MEFSYEEKEPVSPLGQYFNSKVLSFSIMAILELQVPFDESSATNLIREVFLSINPRLSSIMVTDENGHKQWKKVEVKLEEHFHVPNFPFGLSEINYDKYFSNYLSDLAMEHFSQSRPLWEIHLFKYPTSSACATIIFKLHHALGDGYSLMGALLSCLNKADNTNPTLPLTFPHCQRQSSLALLHDNDEYFLFKAFKSAPRVFFSIFNSMWDFGRSIMRSSFVEDDQSPIRSGNLLVEFLPMNISTVTFSLDHIKQIKSELGVTVNDVISGVIFMGTRMYMENTKNGSTKLDTTALVLMNTRDVRGYKSIKEMISPRNMKPSLWGNKFCFLHIPVPFSNHDLNPVDFVMKAHNLIQKKKSSSAVFLTGWFLEVMRKYRGSEFVARYVHSTLKNSSFLISNMIGPLEQMSLANHPVKGLYFMNVGSPQSLVITITSYMGDLRVAIGAERDYVDSASLKLCIENAFQFLFKATCNSTH